MVVDGTGAVWMHSPWQLTRVDPTTGTAQTWDVADDAVFANLLSIEPSDGAGVWLLEADRARLFDGRTFVRDLVVPAEYRGGEGRRINGLVEVGSEVWVSSVAGVARSAGGPWTMVGDDTIDSAVMPTIDTEGQVWSIGQVVLDDGELQQTVSGSTAPGGPPSTGPRRLRSPRRWWPTSPAGVLVRFGLDVRRFDGLSWRAMPLLSSAQRLGNPLSLAMSVAPDGTVWVVGPEGLARVDCVGGVAAGHAGR